MVLQRQREAHRLERSTVGVYGCQGKAAVLAVELLRQLADGSCAGQAQQTGAVARGTGVAREAFWREPKRGGGRALFGAHMPAAIVLDFQSHGASEQLLRLLLRLLDQLAAANHHRVDHQTELTHERRRVGKA